MRFGQYKALSAMLGLMYMFTSAALILLVCQGRHESQCKPNHQNYMVASLMIFQFEHCYCGSLYIPVSSTSSYVYTLEV